MSTITAPTPYPAKTTTATGTIAAIPTTATSTSFADKILITLTQEGRLAQWIHVPLDTSDPNYSSQQLTSSENEDSLLPMPHLTPKTLLGGSNSERETIAQLYATQIASAILTRNPEEKRSVLFGLGLSKFEAKREVFYDTIELVMKVL